MAIVHGTVFDDVMTKGGGRFTRPDGTVVLRPANNTTDSPDVVFGHGGDDFIEGNDGRDTLIGGMGNDTIFGFRETDPGIERDLLSGGAGDDQLFGGGGNDTVRGGTGNDVMDGGAGNDTMDGGEGNDRINGGTGNDTQLGGIGDDKLAGGEGADRLLGDNGNDTIDGGGGNDTQLGGIGDDQLLGGEGADRLLGDNGLDTLEGGGGNDTMHGGEGNDRINGGTGNDMMSGGAGNDVYIVDSTDDVVTEISGQGIDEVRTTLTSYNLGSQLDHLTFIGSGDFTGTGNVRANTIVGGDGNDTLNGGAGNDKIEGGAGIDTAVFSGKLAEYTIANVAGVFTIKDKVTSNGNDGTDTLTGVEVLQFQDGQLFLPGSIDLATLDGTNGFRLIGIDAFDLSGGSVSSAGDVNGDGFADLIIGATGAESGYGAYSDGESYVVFGKATWAGTPSLDLATLDGTNGFRLIGIDLGDYSGYSVSTAGDVNGDGFADLIVGALLAESVGGATDEGESYVVFGKANWAGTPSLDLATLDGTNGFRLIGIDDGDQSGFSVSSAGDVNGDGFDDLIVGAPLSDIPGGYDEEEGQSYVVFGKASWAGTPSLDLETLDGNSGFRFVGFDGHTGNSVSSAGDVNGDGFADLIIGAPSVGYSPNRYGESYVVFGKASWVGTPSLDPASLEGTNGFRLIGGSRVGLSGSSVSSAGDVNGDGFADLIIGAPDAGLLVGHYETYEEGWSYVVFGKANWAGTPSLDLTKLDGTNGFKLVGADEYDNSGNSVSSAGDVNGDGFADVIVGAPFAEPAGGDASGEAYVVYGKADWTSTPSLDLATLDGTNGFRLSGVDSLDRSGQSVSSAGDVNGDGFADLIVGAPYAESAGGVDGEGESYVVFGGNFTGSVVHLGGAGDDLSIGLSEAETFVGGTGNDTMIGGGGANAFQGGEGNDIIAVSTPDFLVADGGTGTDTLALGGTALHLDLTELADSRTRSIERIDIGGIGDNTLTLSVLDVLNLSEASNELLVLGNAGDVVNRGPGWTAAESGGTNGNGTSTIDGQTYQIFNAGQAALLVDTDMTVNV